MPNLIAEGHEDLFGKLINLLPWWGYGKFYFNPISMLNNFDYYYFMYFSTVKLKIIVVFQVFSWFKPIENISSNV